MKHPVPTQQRPAPTVASHQRPVPAPHRALPPVHGHETGHGHGHGHHGHGPGHGHGTPPGHAQPARRMPGPPAGPAAGLPPSQGPAHGVQNQWTMPPARLGDHLVLMPGQLYFGSKAASARTLLGSCVAITLWHPQRRIGGMCHYLLPSRKGPQPAQPEGRFGEEALAMMVRWLRMADTEPKEFEAHLYGGADTQPGSARSEMGIGERNIEVGWQLIDQYGFNLQAVDVGENIPRNVLMNLRTGEVDMRRGTPIARRTGP